MNTKQNKWRPDTVRAAWLREEADAMLAAILTLSAGSLVEPDEYKGVAA